MKLAMILMATMAFALAACGSDSKPKATPTPAATLISDEAFKAAAERAAQDSMLTLADMPRGWTAGPNDSDDDDDLEGDLSPKCAPQVTASAEREKIVAEAKAASDEFSGDNSEQVTTEVEVFRSEQRLIDDQELFEGLFGDCREDFEKLIATGLDATFEEDDNPLRVKSSRVYDLEERKAGDWARDWRWDIRLEGGGFTLNLVYHLTFVRVGRLGGTFSYVDSGELDETIPNNLLTLFVVRMRAANDALPD